MREKNLKLIMELIFIFFLPLIIMSFSITLYQENEINFSNTGNEITATWKSLQFDNSFVNYYNDNMYINKLNFNQLINMQNQHIEREYELLINNGLISVYGSLSISETQYTLSTIQLYKDHKYLLSNFNVEMPISTDIGNSVFITDSSNNTIMSIKENSSLNYVFGTCTNDTLGKFKLQLNDTIAYDITFYPQLYDLTQMFGSGNEPTTIEQFKQYINVNEYHPFTESQIINYESNNIISTNYEYNYSIWGKIKNLLIDNLKIQDSIVLDFVICYTMLWFIMFVIWHFFYLFFDGLVHLFVDWKKRSE